MTPEAPKPSDLNASTTNAGEGRAKTSLEAYTSREVGEERRIEGESNE